jgi:hypothetical protein
MHRLHEHDLVGHALAQEDWVMRLHAQTAMIENGFVHLPNPVPWLAAYLHEITTFPNGRHDDEADSTAQMLDWSKQAGRGHTNARIFEYTPQLAVKASNSQPRREPLSVIARRLGIPRPW